MLIKEVDRLLKPNGYFVYSAPPAYKKVKDFPIIWEKLIDLTISMCWRLIAQHVQTAIWIKENKNSCVQENAENNKLMICKDVDGSKPSWKSPLGNCVEVIDGDYVQKPAHPRSERLVAYPQNLQNIGWSISSKNK